MRKNQIKVISIIILTFFITQYFTKKNILRKYISENNISVLSKNTTFLKLLQTCPLFFDKSSQYYANIDGEIFPKSLPLFLNKSINFDCLNSFHDKPTKTILYWNTFFHGNYSGYGLGKIDPFKKMNCPVINCEATIDKSVVNNSDFVIVHMLPDVDKIDPIPKFRPANQRWIFLLYESPVTYPYNFLKYKSIFNMTATYRFTSDFYSSYYTSAKMIWSKNHSFDNNWNYLVNKTKMAFALISNCQSKFRLKYIENLKNYIEVDIYGRCGKPCLFSNCRAVLSQKYKFLLAFENSFCKEYITEKFFETLQYDIIPVVMGSGQYDYYVSFFKNTQLKKNNNTI